MSRSGYFLGRPEGLSRTRRSPIGLRRQGFFSVEGSLGGADRRRKYYAYYADETNACELQPADRNRAWRSESADDRCGGGRHGSAKSICGESPVNVSPHLRAWTPARSKFRSPLGALALRRTVAPLTIEYRSPHSARECATGRADGSRGWRNRHTTTSTCSEPSSSDTR